MDHAEAAPGQRFVPDEQMAMGHEPVLEAAPVDTEHVEDEPVPEYPDPPRTGDRGVDEVIDAVARAVGGPLEEQLAVYDAAYRTLQDRLADVEG